MLYGVVAMCFVLIYKSTQVVNFAQGEFLLIGAWVCWAALVHLQLPFFVGFLLTLAFMMVFGIAVQTIVLRPLIGEPIISVIMVTIGLSMIIMGAFYWFFKFSKMGLAMRATAFNQQVAQSLGISIKKVFAISWAISAMVSATAGIVIGIVNGVSDALSIIGIKVFPAVILGGLDSVVGAIVGGITIGVLENLAEFFDSQYLQVGNLYNIAPFYVLLIILAFKPYGLFGTKDIERI
ncbi:branched-chain amino acid ABC transporter permease [Vibrio parahaemolyticus]